MATLNVPLDVAIDASGNLLIADSEHHLIRKVDLSTGIITSAAGTGEAGFSGDDGPAVAAALNSPGGVASDSMGNLYIADIGNERVRKVNTQGTISTVAGGGDPPEDKGDAGPAIGASIFPTALTVDSGGNLYISDLSGIRRVDAVSGIITTFAGQQYEEGFAGDDGPALEALFDDLAGIAFDGQGNLYVADSENHRIRVVRGPLND